MPMPIEPAVDDSRKPRAPASVVSGPRAPTTVTVPIPVSAVSPGDRTSAAEARRPAASTVMCTTWSTNPTTRQIAPATRRYWERPARPISRSTPNARPVSGSVVSAVASGHGGAARRRLAGLADRQRRFRGTEPVLRSAASAEPVARCPRGPIDGAFHRELGAIDGAGRVLGWKEQLVLLAEGHVRREDRQAGCVTGGRHRLGLDSMDSAAPTVEEVPPLQQDDQRDDRTDDPDQEEEREHGDQLAPVGDDHGLQEGQD